jgi:SAM-dependent methyltransferase
MGLKLNRNKKKHFLLSFFYRLDKIIFLKKKFKLKLYLDLEWIFNRLSHEYSFENYSRDNHPIRTFSIEYILDYINNTDRVLDLGCKYGDIAKSISEKANYVLGIDYDSNAINIAKSNNKGIANLDCVYAEAFEYLDSNKKSFDVLILSHILEHIDNPEEFLNKFSSFFKRIYIEVPDFDASYFNHMRKDLGLKLQYTDNDHVFEFDRVEMSNLIHSCNLKIDLAEYRFGVQKIWCSHIE